MQTRLYYPVRVPVGTKVTWAGIDYEVIGYDANTQKLILEQLELPIKTFHKPWFGE